MIEKIKEIALNLSENMGIDEVVFGSSYNAVRLEDGNTGVAFSFRVSNGDLRKGVIAFKDAHSCISKLSSLDVGIASFALATINAMFNRKRESLIYGNLLDHLKVGREDTLGMVGYFRPMMPRIKEMTNNVYVFEQIAQKDGEVFPEEDAYRLLKECDIAIISSTSIINHTIERLLKSISRSREVVMLGASTPLIPEAFQGTPVTLLSGVIVEDSSSLLRIVSEGGGVRAFKQYVSRVNLRLKSNR